MKVVVVKEEVHGVICVAKDYASAIKWLIDNEWITEYTEFWNDELEKHETLKDILGENWERDVPYLPEEFYENGGYYFSFEEIVGM